MEDLEKLREQCSMTVSAVNQLKLEVSSLKEQVFVNIIIKSLYKLVICCGLMKIAIILESCALKELDILKLSAFS